MLRSTKADFERPQVSPKKALSLRRKLSALLACLFLGDISWNENALNPALQDMLLDLLCVLVLVEVCNADVSSLASIVHSDGAPNAGITARDDRHLCQARDPLEVGGSAEEQTESGNDTIPCPSIFHCPCKSHSHSLGRGPF